MRKRKKRWRSLRGHSRNIDRRLERIKSYVDALDRVKEAQFDHLSEFEETWVDGCRAGMAIVYDLMKGRVQDVAIRSKFKPRPIKMRYYPEAERTIKDDSLIDDRRKAFM